MNVLHELRGGRTRGSVFWCLAFVALCAVVPSYVCSYLVQSSTWNRGALSVLFDVATGGLGACWCLVLALVCLSVQGWKRFTLLALLSSVIVASFVNSAVVLIVYRLNGQFFSPTSTGLHTALLGGKFVWRSALSGFSIGELIAFLVVAMGVPTIALLRIGGMGRLRVRTSATVLAALTIVTVVALSIDGMRRVHSSNPWDGLQRKITILDSAWNTFRELPFPFSLAYLTRMSTTRHQCLHLPDSEVVKGIDERMTSPLEPRAVAPLPESSRSITLVGFQLESINRDIARAKFTSGAHVMPFLHAALDESGLGEGHRSFLSSVQVGGTSDAEFATLCSLEPSLSGMAMDRMVEFRSMCAPTWLEMLGFDTSAVHAFYGHMYNRASAYPVFGFRNVLTLHELQKISGAGNRPLTDKEVLAHILALPIAPGKVHRFFHFVGLDTHAPYAPTSEPEFQVERERFQCPSCDAETLAGFAREANKLDADFKSTVDALALRSLTDDGITIFYVYGDHAPPLRSDIFSDGTALHQTPTLLRARDQIIPYVAFVVSRGRVLVLPVPHDDAATMRSQVDIFPTLALQLKEVNIPTVRQLGASLERYAAQRIRFHESSRLSGMLLVSRQGVRDLMPEDWYWTEIARTERAFGCNVVQQSHSQSTGSLPTSAIP